MSRLTQESRVFHSSWYFSHSRNKSLKTRCFDTVIAILKMPEAGHPQVCLSYTQVPLWFGHGVQQRGQPTRSALLWVRYCRCQMTCAKIKWER